MLRQSPPPPPPPHPPVQVELPTGVADSVYLSALEAALAQTAQQFPRPDLVVYNAGTDVLAGDPLGRMAVSEAAVVQRDEAVFTWAAQQVGGAVQHGAANPELGLLSRSQWEGGERCPCDARSTRLGHLSTSAAL
jgi:hypothetical protein